MSKIKIPYSRQYIDKHDISAVTKALKEDIISNGDKSILFEKKIKLFLKCKYSTVCNSGTSALHLALMAINLKKNDAVIMPSVNFIASYNICKNLGAKIFLADVNKSTGQMEPKHVIQCLEKFKLKKIKALIVMYNGGYPENAGRFKNLKKLSNFYLVEDACHALGASYSFNNKIYKLGSCKHSDISTFSLHPLKTITTGEGGIVTTNSKALDYKIKKLRSLGIIRNKRHPWKYDVEIPGYNFRLNEFQCALGISQLKKIDKFISFRKNVYKIYNKKLSTIKDINIPKYNFSNKPSYHLYLINLKKPNLKLKENFIKYMIKNNIFVQYHYIPIYKFGIFNDKSINNEAESYFQSTISIPIFYNYTLKKQNYVIKKIKFFFQKKN